VASPFTNAVSCYKDAVQFSASVAMLLFASFDEISAEFCILSVDDLKS